MSQRGDVEAVAGWLYTYETGKPADTTIPEQYRIAAADLVYRALAGEATAARLPGDAPERTEGTDTPDEAALLAVEGAVPVSPDRLNGPSGSRPSLSTLAEGTADQPSHRIKFPPGITSADQLYCVTCKGTVVLDGYPDRTDGEWIHMRDWKANQAMTDQQQTVVITRLGDRHAELHARDFAHSVAIEVDAGSLADVLRQLSERVPPLPPGRYSLSVSEPFDAEVKP